MDTNNDKNLHKEYWGFLGNEITSFYKKNRKPLFYFGLLVVLAGAVYLGLLKYNPEFSFPFGTFSINKEVVDKEIESPNSKILDRSIFDLADEIRPGKLTSQERVNFVSNIAGLQTRTEQGVVEDIGTDGLTMLIRGTGTNGGLGIVRCDFSWNWKARLALLKRETEIKFMGTISNYDLSRDWIVLKSCVLIDGAQ